MPCSVEFGELQVPTNSLRITSPSGVTCLPVCCHETHVSQQFGGQRIHDGLLSSMKKAHLSAQCGPMLTRRIFESNDFVSTFQWAGAPSLVEYVAQCAVA